MKRFSVTVKGVTRMVALWLLRFADWAEDVEAEVRASVGQDSSLLARKDELSSAASTDKESPRDT